MEEWNSDVEVDMTTADFLFPPSSWVMEQQQQPHHVLIEQDLNLHRAVRSLPIQTDIPIRTLIRKIMAEAEAEAEAKAEKKMKEVEEALKRYEEEKRRKKEEEEEEEEKKRGREDFISNLPDSLLKKILSYLPIHEQAQSSILSHRWNPIVSQLWASNPFLRISRDNTLLCRLQHLGGNLKIIRLDRLRLNKDQIDAFLSDVSTPLLQDLMFDECEFLDGPVYLSHPTINKLHITSCSVYSLHCFFIADLPKLESIRFKYLDNPLLLLRPATSLVEASLHNDYCCSLRETELYLHLMQFMPRLRRLAITFEMFHCMVVGDPKHSMESFKDLEELFVGKFENLEELHLENGTVTDALCVALVTFIDGNPSIQKLCLKVDIDKRTTSWNRYDHCSDLDSYYPHLDTSPPFPNRQPFPLLLHLKRFRIIGSNRKWGEIRLARLILKHAVALESFHVICRCRGKDGIHWPSFHDDKDFTRVWQMHDNHMPPETQNYSCYWERLQVETDEDMIHKKHPDCQKGFSEATVPVIVTHRDIICPLHYDKDD